MAGISLHKPLFIDVTAEDRGNAGKANNDAKVHFTHTCTLESFGFKEHVPKPQGGEEPYSTLSAL